MRQKVPIIIGSTGIFLLIFALFLETLSYRPGIIGVLVALAFLIMGIKRLKGYAFTAWVIVAVSLSISYPDIFIQWGEFKLELLIIPLTQVIMFGMGTTLSLKDFGKVVKSPWPVFFGLLLQFSVMPVVGYLIARIGGFEPEVAAGIILIGSCSGGVASNLMAYLAGGNVALSVAMTFVSTLLAPIATPFLMAWLAGTFVPIDAVKMMFSILNMIIIPVLAGLVANEILYGNKSWNHNIKKMLGLIFLILAVILFTIWMGVDFFGALYSGLLVGSVLLLLVATSHLVISQLLNRPNTWVDSTLPIISMVGICMVLMIIIAQTFDVLIAVGLLLFLGAIIHNGIGYLLGYWGSKFFGKFLGKIGYRLGFFLKPISLINESESRTIAFEVGMQNGGMASGLAIDVLNSYSSALPPNVFGTWMNISGSMLANYWKQNPTKSKS